MRKGKDTTKSKGKPTLKKTNGHGFFIYSIIMNLLNYQITDGWSRLIEIDGSNFTILNFL